MIESLFHPALNFYRDIINYCHLAGGLMIIETSLTVGNIANFNLCSI